MRTLAILVALTLCTGCGVWDEIDNASKQMDQNSPRGKKAAKAEKAAESPSAPGAPAPAGKEGPGILHDLVVWTKKKLEGPPPPPDPLDVPVTCSIGKSVLFTTRGECEARHGQAKDLPPKS